VLFRSGAVISNQEFKWPEKDAEAVSLDNGKGIKWTPVDSNGKRTAEFTLGDFDVFGRFLHELLGTVYQPLETPDAK
jgi:hypothetical protein